MMKILLRSLGVLLILVLPVCAATRPAVGQSAPPFVLRTLDDRPVELRQLVAQRPVVLVALRGWVGYQCPLCTRQVHDFVSQAAEFAQRGVQVVMVYPGPAAELRAKAQEFLQDKQWPADFIFVLDPDFTFTNAYGLRWDAPRETAYPSTFVLDRGGVIRFAQVSQTHGGRVSAAAALAAVPVPPPTMP